MKIKLTTLLLLFLAWHCCAYAQARTSLGGRITDEQQTPLCAVSVILRSLPDSTYIAGVATDNEGRFSLSVSPDRDYLLTAAYLGYKSFDCPCKAGDTLAITLRPDPQVMQEVVIRGERPIVKAEGSKLIFDTHALTRNKVVETAWDILDKLPGVEVSGSQVSIIGSRKVTVIIDGKPSTLSGDQLRTVLESIPAEQVKQTEVIQNAPPRYHTNGAIINIVTLRPGKHTVEGQLSAHYRDNYYGRGGVAGNLLVATPRLSWSTIYAPTWSKSILPSDTRALHKVGDQTYDIGISNISRHASDIHEFRTSLNYDISDKSSVSVTYTGNFVPNDDGDSRSTGNFQDSRNLARSEQQLHNLALDYSAPFGLGLGFNYTHYRMDKTQNLDILYHSSSEREHLLTRDMQEVDNYLFYADQSHNLARNWTLGYGVSYFHAANRNTQNYNGSTSSRPTDNIATRLGEDKVDFYLSTGSRFANGISFEASLKGEYYRIEEYRKWAVYPQFSFTRMKTPNRILKIGLTTDKTYPEYWAMQPSINYIDGYTEIHGSPDLRPSLEYTLNASYIFNRRYMLQAFYSYTKDENKQSPYQSPDRPVLIYKSTNWDYEQKVGIMAVVPFSIGRWFSSQVTLCCLTVFDRCNEFFDQRFNRHKTLVMFNTDNTITLHKNLHLEFSSHVQSPAIQGTFDIGTLFTMSAGVKWSLLRNKMSLSLKCEDLFDTGNFPLRLRHNGQYADLNNSVRYNRATTLRLVYRFGDYKERKMKEVDTSRFAR